MAQQFWATSWDQYIPATQDKKKLFLVYTVFQLYEIINIHHPINFIEVNHTLLWWKCPWSADKDRLVSILLEDSGSEGSNLHPIPMSWQ